MPLGCIAREESLPRLPGIGEVVLTKLQQHLPGLRKTETDGTVGGQGKDGVIVPLALG